MSLSLLNDYLSDSSEPDHLTPPLQAPASRECEGRSHGSRDIADTAAAEPEPEPEPEGKLPEGKLPEGKLPEQSDDRVKDAFSRQPNAKEASADEPVVNETSQLSCTSNELQNAHLPHHNASAMSSTPQIPSELARELRAAGHDLNDINFIDIDAASTTVQPHTPAHISHRALHNTTSRLAHHISKDSVSRIARRKHQITALAADAIAMQTAQNAIPSSQRSHHQMYKSHK